MSVDLLGTNWDQCRSMVQYSFTSTETRRLVRTDSPGRPPQSTLTQLLNHEHLFTYGPVWIYIGLQHFSHGFTTFFIQRTVPESEARSVHGGWVTVGLRARFCARHEISPEAANRVQTLESPSDETLKPRSPVCIHRELRSCV